MKPEVVAVDDGPPAERLKELTGRCTVLLRHAILTINALPDRERRFLASPQSSMPTPVRNIAESFNSAAAKAETSRAASFRPSPADVGRYLEVLAWLTWLGNTGKEGKRAVRIIIARAYGRPFWKMARREFNRSDDPVRRWEAAAIEAIAIRYWRRIDEMGP